MLELPGDSSISWSRELGPLGLQLILPEGYVVPEIELKASTWARYALVNESYLWPYINFFTCSFIHLFWIVSYFSKCF